MLKRIITSIVAVCVLVPVLIFSETWVFPVGVAICAVIGIFEMLGCIGQRKNLFLTLPLCAIAAFFPLYARYASLGNNGAYELLKMGVGIAFVTALYVFGVAVYANKSVKITDAGLLFGTSFYIIAAFTCLVYIHDFAYLGKHIYLLCFICAWVTDTFAYFTGMLFGKHKLIPEVSPKKTIEGAIGGVVFCSVAMVVFGLIIENFFNPENSFHANYLVLALLGLVLSIISQIGDLWASLIKREHGVKDYSRMLPGHGGVMDRFDSILAISTVLMAVCMVFPPFN